MFDLQVGFVRPHIYRTLKFRGVGCQDEWWGSDCPVPAFPDLLSLFSSPQSSKRPGRPGSWGLALTCGNTGEAVPRAGWRLPGTCFWPGWGRIELWKVLPLLTHYILFSGFKEPVKGEVKARSKLPLLPCSEWMLLRAEGVHMLLSGLQVGGDKENIYSFDDFSLWKGKVEIPSTLLDCLCILDTVGGRCSLRWLMKIMSRFLCRLMFLFVGKDRK